MLFEPRLCQLFLWCLQCHLWLLCLFRISYAFSLCFLWTEDTSFDFIFLLVYVIRWMTLGILMLIGFHCLQVAEKPSIFLLACLWSWNLKPTRMHCVKMRMVYVARVCPSWIYSFPPPCSLNCWADLILLYHIEWIYGNLYARVISFISCMLLFLVTYFVHSVVHYVSSSPNR